jgi:hypothetical protein
MNRTAKNNKITILIVLIVTAFSFIILNSTVVFSAEEKKESISAEEKKEGIGDTGTDPRDFAPKFMPYYRYTELENGLEQNKNGLSQIPGGGVTLPGDLPISDELDGKETGIGDMNLRFMYRHDWDFLGFDWMTGAELVFPTANEDVLGSETFIVKPMVTMVRDIGFWPAPGAFFALMNFYGFDAWKDSNRDDVSQYIGRYFFMLPVHPSGIYLLPEVQFIYDFENSHGSLWIGPEVGKLLAPGRILYLKPGFGIDPDEDEGDRNWSFEVGFRYFF